jgi:hypothetical protein
LQYLAAFNLFVLPLEADANYTALSLCIVMTLQLTVVRPVAAQHNGLFLILLQNPVKCCKYRL